MMQSTNILQWVQNWFSNHCDGDWEHGEGIKIQSLDNPGWVLKISLKDTDFEDLEIQYVLFEVSEDDWYGIEVKNSIFNAAGDPSKLEFLLWKFKELVEQRI